MKLELKTLTTCGAKSDGEIIEINSLDSAGVPVCVAFDHAQSIVMMLLGPLTDALRRMSERTRRAMRFY